MSTSWPDLPGMDYRYGFPLAPEGVPVLEALPQAEREVLLARLETAAFEALVLCDLAELP